MNIAWLAVIVGAVVGILGNKYQWGWLRTAGGLIIIAALLISLFGCASTPPAVVASAPIPTPTPVIIPPDPYSALSPDVVQAIRTGEPGPLQEGITKTYKYSPDEQWTINVQPFEATEIRLSPDEDTDDNNVILGDPDRWDEKVGEHVVLVKAKASDKYVDPKTGRPTPGDYDVRGNVVIHTTKGRVYHIQLKLKRPPTPVITWFYPEEVKAEETVRVAAIKQAQALGQLAADPTPTPTPSQEVIKR